MKVLLNTLYATDYYARHEEIGIASIAAYLREKGYEVKLLGSTYDKIDYESIAKYNPDIVGLTIYGITKDISYKFINELKQRHSNVLVCIGGYLATTFDKEMLQENVNIDYVVRGEGEVSFYNLLENIKNNKIQNSLSVTYRNGDEIIRNELVPEYESLSSYPMPSRDYLINNKLTTATCFFSRGCTAGCHFCSTPNYWKKWRGREVHQVVDEIKYLSELGVKYLLIQDCSFENPGSNYKRVMEMADAIKNANLDIMYFIALRAEFSRKLSTDLIKLLKDSGLFLVNIGIEAGNKNDLKTYGKPANLDDNQRILDILSENNIGYKMGFMNFNTYSTFNNLRENINFLHKNNQSWRTWHFFSSYKAYQGTVLYDQILKDQYVLNDQFDNTTYKFSDEKVGKLFNYMDTHLTKVLKTDELFKQNHLIDSIHFALYEFYNRFKEDVDLLKPQEQALNVELRKYGSVNEKWFAQLIDYFEQTEEINYDEADKIVLNIIKEFNILAALEKVNAIKYNILSQLYKDKKYQKAMFCQKYAN